MGVQFTERRLGVKGLKGVSAGDEEPGRFGPGEVGVFPSCSHTPAIPLQQTQASTILRPLLCAQKFLTIISSELLAAAADIGLEHHRTPHYQAQHRYYPAQTREPQHPDPSPGHALLLLTSCWTCSDRNHWPVLSPPMASPRQAARGGDGAGAGAGCKAED